MTQASDTPLAAWQQLHLAASALDLSAALVRVLATTSNEALRLRIATEFASPALLFRSLTRTARLLSIGPSAAPPPALATASSLWVPPISLGCTLLLRLPPAALPPTVRAAMCGPLVGAALREANGFLEAATQRQDAGADSGESPEETVDWSTCTESSVRFSCWWLHYFELVHAL